MQLLLSVVAILIILFFNSCFEHEISVLTKDFFFDFVPLGLFRFVVGVVGVEIQVVFYFNFIIQADIMRDLILLLDQVQLFSDSRIVLESVLANDEQLFNDVLDASLNFALVQDGPEPLEDCIDPSWCSL